MFTVLSQPDDLRRCSANLTRELAFWLKIPRAYLVPCTVVEPGGFSFCKPEVINNTVFLRDILIIADDPDLFRIVMFLEVVQNSPFDLAVQGEIIGDFFSGQNYIGS